MKQVKHVVNDLKPVEIERDIHVGRRSSGHAPALGADKPQLPSSVADRDNERVVVEGEEVPVVDLDGEREREVKGESGRRVDSDVVEAEPCELDGRIGWVEKKDG